MKTSNSTKASFTTTDLQSNMHFSCKATKPAPKKACPWGHVEIDRSIKIEFKL